MLTDRQNSFYIRMRELSKEGSTASLRERKYLNRSANAIERGLKFQDAVNALTLSLTGVAELERKKGRKFEFSPEVKKLFDELVAIYGEPDFRGLNELGKIRVYSGSSSTQVNSQIINGVK